jgi:membrane protein YdbS with pleckstrin-like domain
METMEPTKNDTIKIGDWLITLIVTAIPLVGIIMLFVWGFSSGTHPTKANWAKAMLILVLIIIVLYIILFAVFGAAFMGMMNTDMMNDY